MEFINIGEQRAVALTKALSRVKLAAMYQLLGVRNFGSCQDQWKYVRCNHARVKDNSLIPKEGGRVESVAGFLKNRAEINQYFLISYYFTYGKLR